MNGRDTILIVDDMEVNRAILRGLFEEDYNILEAENGDQAMLLLEQLHDNIAALLLDLVMPIKDGYQVMMEMRAKSLMNEVPVVVITAEGSAENEVRAFDLGASDIIMKPFEPYVVKRRVQNIVELHRHKIHLEDLVEEQAKRLRQSNEVMIDSLSSIIEYRNLESGQHTLRIRMFTKILLEDVARTCQEYDLNERNISIIASAASMHDIGKIAIPDSILNKPGRLTTEEFEVMKTHTTRGCEILDGLDRMSDREYLQYAYNICRYHHERWDGRGYPDGLKGDNIPVCAQVVGIADCYDALTTDRVYKKAFPHEQAFNMILNGECGMFSPKLLESLKNVRDQFDELAREYADGRSPKADIISAEPSRPVFRDEALDSIQLAQVKYFTLLRYVGSTVVEVDLGAGIYHMVYTPNPDFELLRTGSTFEDAMRNLAAGAVHPEDRHMVLDTLDEYMEEFFSAGLMKRSRRYRVYSRATGGYRWYTATILRLETDDPRQRKALIVWEDAGEAGGEQNDAAAASPEREPELRNLLGVVQRFRNDKYFTLAGVSQSFTALLGYTAAEMEERFGNRYLEVVCPEDRKSLLRQTREQLRAGSTVEAEYRVRRKDGGVIWLLDKSQMVTDPDGQEYLYSMLVDVSQTKQAQEELRLTLERHQIIMAQTNDIIFEWDIRQDTVTYSSNWMAKFGYHPIGAEISRRVPVASHIHPEDVPVFVESMRRMAGGEPYGEAEIRLAKADGRYLWCRVRATAQMGEDGKPLKAVGVVVDIDGEKRAAQALQEKAERDALTKLYNKNSARRQIEEYLLQRPEAELAALLIIDVDNFKQVNDRYGHMFGDAALTEIADEIRKLFRNADIISRIGGDEFMVFLKRIPDVSVVEDRAGQLIAAFQGLFRESLPDCRLSCSVGVALAPEHGIGFQDLFQRADRALYRAKNQGKDQYVIYDGAAADGPFGHIPPDASVVNTRIDSDEQLSLTPDGLMQYALHRLYESGDVEQAVHSVLELVGEQFNVSRAYIFENAPDNHTCSNTFEWCNEGIAPQKEKLQSIHYVEDLGGEYEENFNENGIFYCPDVSTLPQKQYAILKPQGIKAMLQCAIRDNGVFRGYVGFDECVTSRLWTQAQIDALTFLSELMSVFLLKKRAQDATAETARDLRQLLDTQNSWIYVIDPDTYELLYINAKTHTIAPEARMGMRCHKAFLDRDKPCEGCPAQDIRRAVNRTVEFYNPHLDVWSSADASLIRWGGQEACLLSCHDIDKYKRGEERA